MLRPPLWTIPVTIGAGVAVSVSSRVNGQFAVIVGNPFEAAIVNFAVGLIALSILLVAIPSVRSGLRLIRPALVARTLPWWALLGGLGGAIYVTMQSVSVPLIGVAAFTVAVVAGQTSSSLLVDRFGIGPAGRQVVTGTRVLGAVITVIAVTIAVSNRFSGASLSIAAVLMAFAGGVSLSGQQAFNGRLGVAARQPITAAWVSFAVGFVLLGILIAIMWATNHIDFGALPTSPWWLYIPGLMGVIYIITAAWIVPKIGVLIFGLTVVVGQLLGALLLDVFFPVSTSAVGWQLVTGVVLTFVAVLIASRPRRG